MTGVAARYTDDMPIQSGPYVGLNCRLATDLPLNDCLESYFLMDVGAGYVFRNQLNGLRLDVSVNNVLDERHREFVGAPKLGRMAMARKRRPAVQCAGGLLFCTRRTHYIQYSTVSALIASASMGSLTGHFRRIPTHLS